MLQKNQVYPLKKLGGSFGLFPPFSKFPKNMPKPLKPSPSLQALIFAQKSKILILGVWEIQFCISFMF